MQLTEQEIERMVMEASRAEFLAGQSFRIHFPWHEETSTSAGAEPSSSGTSKHILMVGLVSLRQQIKNVPSEQSSRTMRDGNGLL